MIDKMGSVKLVAQGKSEPPRTSTVASSCHVDKKGCTPEKANAIAMQIIKGQEQ